MQRRSTVWRAELAGRVAPPRGLLRSSIGELPDRANVTCYSTNQDEIVVAAFRCKA
jgi:hypothetical protein